MSSSITLRLETPELADKLDALAKATDRSRNWLMNRALEEYVELQSWQIAKIEEGLAQANRGEFVPQEEMDAFFAKYGPEETQTRGRRA